MRVSKGVARQVLVGLVGIVLAGPAPNAAALSLPAGSFVAGAAAPLATPVDPSAVAGRIAFVGATGGGSTISSMRANGTDVQAVTSPAPGPPAAVDGHPSWAPDGSAIAFASNRAGSNDIWTVAPDGTGLAQLTNDPGDELDPAWSPDGTELAFSRSRALDGGGTAFDIVVMTADGNNAVALTAGTGADRDPAWSPSGARIAFVRDGVLTVMNADGSALTPLVSSITTASAPAWSRDGTRIAFAVAAGGRSDVDVVNATDGSGLATVTRGTSGGSDPTWSPDGSRIGYVGTGGSASTIATILPDGTCPATLLTGASGETLGEPAWQGGIPGTLAVSAAPGCRSLQRGSRASFTIGLSRGDVTSPIDLSIDGLPAGATAAFGPNPAWLSSAALVIQTSECGTATATGTFTVTVTASADRETRSTTLTLVVSDAPPVAAAPVSALVTGTKGTTTTPIRTSWSACDHEAISSYAVDRAYAGVWTRVSTGPATAISQWLADGGTYQYRASAADPTHGSGVAWTSSRSFGPVVTEAGSSSVVRSGTWSAGYSTSYSGGSTMWASAAGAWASYTFVGSGVAWLGYAGPNRGSARVYIDGAYTATVSEYQSTYAARRLLYAANWPAQGRHTIKVVVLGTVGHPRVDVDAFVILRSASSYVVNTYNGRMTTESPENITCVSASALTASNYSWGATTPEYYSHVIAADWYAQVRTSRQDFHDKYDYTGIEPGLDPRGWAWLLWAHAPPAHGYHDYWSASQGTANSWLMWNILRAGEPAGAVVFRSLHAIDVVGFSSNIDPRIGAATINGFYVVDPWYPNAKSVKADGGTIGLAPNTYLTLGTWNASYFLPYVDKKYEAVHGANLWHNQYVAILRTVDGTQEPTRTYDTMPALYGTAPTAAPTPATGTATTLPTAPDPVASPGDLTAAVRDGIERHGLADTEGFGIAANDVAGLTLGRRVSVQSLDPDFPAYELVEVRARGRVVAVALLTQADGGLRFAGLQSAYPGNTMRDATAVRAAFARAGIVVRGLGVAWTPSADSFEPFSPYWVATDAGGHRHFLTPAGAIVANLASTGR